MKNRWLIALSAVGIHISIGSIYAYSVLKIPLFDHYGWADAVSYSFTVAIVFLGLSAAFMGHFVEKKGPRRAGTVAALAYGIGVIGAGVACWFAAQALAPVAQQAIAEQAIQETLIEVDQSLAQQLVAAQQQLAVVTASGSAESGDPLALAKAQRQVHALQQAHSTVASLLIGQQGDAEVLATTTVQATIDTQIAAERAANLAIGAVEPGDAAALATAKDDAAVARTTKQALITALLTPAAAGWQWVFLIFYGVLGGIGLGVGYISPVSTLVKWFPDRRGLATGLAIMGFGFASLIFAPTMNWLMDGFNPATMFMILGSVYLVLMLAAASYLAPPPKDFAPAGMKATASHKPAPIKQDLSQMTANEAITTSRFYYLWLMLFINVTCGIALISVASPMAQEMVGMSPGQAAAMVGLMGLFNGLGRIGWASVSDFLGRSNTYLAFFVLQIAAFLLLPQTVAYAVVFQAVVFLILTCYGGGFASIPAFIGDIFGTKQLGAIHGYVLTAWAAAGIAGPITAAYVRGATGDYAMTLLIFAGLFVVALVVNILMKIDMARLRRKQTVSSPLVTQAQPA